MKLHISKIQRTTEAGNTIFAVDFLEVPVTVPQSVLEGVAGQEAVARGRRVEDEDEEGCFDREDSSKGEEGDSFLGLFNWYKARRYCPVSKLKQINDLHRIFIIIDFKNQTKSLEFHFFVIKCFFINMVNLIN